MKWFWKRDIPTLSPLEAYNRWASSYANESNPVKAESDQLVSQWLPPLLDRTFLDIGCGVGKLCALAAEQGASGILGIDPSQAMINQAIAHCPSGSFLCDSIVNAQLPTNNFDIAVALLSLGHVENLSAALEKIVSCLKSGATLIITDFHPFLTLQQAKRTFRDPHSGKAYAVHHYLHLFEEYFNALQQLPVIITDFREPRYNDVPVVFGLRIQKIP